MFGKNLFKNEDGTVKPIRITLFVCLIVGLIMAFFLKDTNVFKPALNTTTTTNPISTTTMNLCDNCSFKFTREAIDIEAGTQVYLSDILDVTNIEIYKIKFTSSDVNIAKVASQSGEMFIKAEEIIGNVTIKAEYENISEEIEVNVIATSIKEAHLEDKIYYAYVNKNNKIEVETIPKGAPYKLLELSTENPEIAEFNEEGELVGKQVGETKMILTTKRKLTEEEKKTYGENPPETIDIVEEATCYIVNNMITVKIKEGNNYKETNEYLYRGSYSGDVIVALHLEDNNNEGFNGNSVTWEYIPQGSINITSITPEGLAPNNVDYLYKVSITVDTNQNMDENKATIYFTLPDGSKARLVINKQ